jgi:hypothetical protein
VSISGHEPIPNGARSRVCGSAASRVSISGSGMIPQVRRRLHRRPGPPRGNHAGAISANSPPGRPIENTARSLRISVSIDSRLTLPGTDLISARTESSPVSSSGTSTATRPRSRAATSAGSRATIRAVSVCSALCSAERTIRSTRPAAGGPIPLRAAAHQQLVAHQLRAPLCLAHVGGQPLGQLVRIRHRALPEAQVRADL